MANISAKDVMELRKKTGCGMMECKKALVETDGNFDEAIKYLREKGLSVAAKKADRIAAEGVVDILTDNGVTAIIEVNAETDFVAKNASFQEFVKGILRTIVANKPADLNALNALNFDGTEVTVEAELKNMIFTIGENMSIQIFFKGFFALIGHVGGQQGHAVGTSLTGGGHAGDRRVAGGGQVLLTHHRCLEQATVSGQAVDGNLFLCQNIHADFQRSHGGIKRSPEEVCKCKFNTRSTEIHGLSAFKSCYRLIQKDNLISST